MEDMDQVLLHLKAPKGDHDLVEVLKAYSYADVMAYWRGTDEGRDGLYFVLQGRSHVIEATIQRLASGLWFASKLQTLS